MKEINNKLNLNQTKMTFCHMLTNNEAKNYNRKYFKINNISYPRNQF